MKTSQDKVDSRNPLEKDELVAQTKSKAGDEHGGCTDVVCLFIFGALWAVLLLLGTGAFLTGDSSTLFHDRDYLGNRCGEGDFANRTQTYYPRMALDLSIQSERVRDAPWSVSLYALCVTECPRRGSRIADYGFGTTALAVREEWEAELDTYPTINRCLPRVTRNLTTKALCEVPSCTEMVRPCMATGLGFSGVPANAWLMQSRLDLSQCRREVDVTLVTAVQEPNSQRYLDYLQHLATGVAQAVKSLLYYKWLILSFGVVLPIVLGSGWLLFLLFCGSFAVYLALVALLVLLFSSTLLCAYKGMGSSFFGLQVHELVNREVDHFEAENREHALLAGALRDALSVDEEQTELYRGLSLTLGLLFALVLLYISSAAKDIRRTADLVHEATRVVISSPAVVLLPLLTAVPQFLSMLYGGALLLMLITETHSYQQQGEMAAQLTQLAGEQGSGSSALSTLPAAGSGSLLVPETLLMLFALFWTYHFLHSLLGITVSGVVYNFYFQRKTLPDAQRLPFPTIHFLMRVLRNHVGTVAFSSIVLALLSFFRPPLEYIDEHTNRPGTPNSCFRLIFKCCKCCLFCFERTIKALSSYCYVAVIVEKASFCAASWKTYAATKDHPEQLSANKVAQLVLFTIQSVSIPIICSITGYNTISLMAPQLSTFGSEWQALLDTLVPTAAVLLLSLVMSRCFACLYEHLISALTVCVVRDVRENSPPLISKSLWKAFNLQPAWDDREFVVFIADSSRGSARRSHGASHGAHDAVRGSAARPSMEGGAYAYQNAYLMQQNPRGGSTPMAVPRMM